MEDFLRIRRLRLNLSRDFQMSTSFAILEIIFRSFTNTHAHTSFLLFFFRQTKSNQLIGEFKIN